MNEEKQENLLKVKHYLKVNKIEYHELSPGTHFRIFFGRKPYRSEQSYIDLWPTTLRWYDFDSELNGQGIESFIKFYNSSKIISKSQNDSNNTKLYSREPEMIRDASTWIERYKVPKGWLVNTMHLSCGVLASCFIPDDNHEWILEEKIDNKITVGDASKPLDK